MKLDKDQVKHIANLARLKLSDEEMDKMQDQLSEVLGYVEQLQEVDTTNVAPTSQVTGLNDVLREDEEEDWDKGEVDKALDQAPDKDGREIKVKRVLD